MANKKMLIKTTTENDLPPFHHECRCDILPLDNDEDAGFLHKIRGEIILIIGTILIGTMLCFYSNVNAATTPKVFTIQEDQPVCYYFDDMKKLAEMSEHDDSEAFYKMFQSKRCTSLKKGTSFYIVDKIDIFKKIRVKGTTREYWTVYE